MAIYWMKTADVYPDGRWHDQAFIAFDPDVCSPALTRLEATRSSAPSPWWSAAPIPVFGNGR